MLVTPPSATSPAVATRRALSPSLGAAATSARGSGCPQSPGVPAVPLGAAAPGSSLLFQPRTAAAGGMGAE